MSYKVYNIDNINEWESVYNSLPEEYRHISYSPVYHKLFEINGDGKAELFYYESDGSIFYYPYLVTETKSVGDVFLDEPVYDIKSVFGYTGPLFINEDNDFVKESYKLFQIYCTEQNFLCELIRFNPVLENHLNLVDIKLHEFIGVKKYVLLDLKAHEDFRDNYKPKYRKEIRRYFGITERIKCDITEESVSKFRKLYQKQMLEKNADSYYFFTEEYFDNLLSLLKNYGCLHYVEDGGEMKAAVVFVFDKHTAYYYHSCRDTSDAISNWYSKILLDYTFNKFKEKGFHYCMIGGGVSNSNDDSLLSFKRNISPLERTFIMGKRILLKEKYNTVIKIWEEQYPALKEKYSSFLEKFRLK
jgi:Acetyltransferase (GNAT) domain